MGAHSTSGIDHLNAITDESRDYSIDRIVVHPKFRSKSPPKNDIALVQLRQRVQFNRFMRPACLATEAFAPQLGTGAIATGWSRNALTNEPRDKLLKDTLVLVDQTDCSAAYESRNVTILEDIHLCAGPKNETYALCGVSIFSNEILFLLYIFYLFLGRRRWSTTNHSSR